MFEEAESVSNLRSPAAVAPSGNVATKLYPLYPPTETQLVGWSYLLNSTGNSGKTLFFYTDSSLSATLPLK